MAKNFYAKLTAGGDYSVMGIKFQIGVELPVDENLHDYLDGNPQFEVRSEEVKDGAKSAEDKDPLDDLDKPDLVSLCEAYGLSKSGTKDELKVRIREYEASQK